MQMFKGCRREETAPHIFAIAQSAYRQLLTTRQDQTIVMLGRSGSGKSTSCQHLLQYLVTIAAGSGKVYSGDFFYQAVGDVSVSFFWLFQPLVL